MLFLKFDVARKVPEESKSYKKRGDQVVHS